MGPLVATRVMANFPDIPTIPYIPIIIQISWSLWFQKGMTVDVQTLSTVLSFNTFLTLPPFLKFPSSFKSAQACGSKTE